MEPPETQHPPQAPPPPKPRPTLHITSEPLTTPDLHALLQSHISTLRTLNTLHNQLGHLLPLSSLSSPSITLYTARDAGTHDLLGCAALKQISPTHGEIKCMRTAPGHERKGVAGALVRYLVSVARERGYARVSLETGVQGEFEAARRLYGRAGFVECGAYEGYADGGEVEGSVFMSFYLDGVAEGGEGGEVR